MQSFSKYNFIHIALYNMSSVLEYGISKTVYIIII